MEKKRSVGIIVLGVFLLINSLRIIAGLIFSIGMGPISLFLALYLFGSGTVAIISAVGLLLLKNWARILTLILIVLNIIRASLYFIKGVNVSASFGGHQVLFPMAVELAIIVIVGILIVCYLNSPKVKEQFKEKET